MLRRDLLPPLVYCVLLVCPTAEAHRLEPISTEFARPFRPGYGSLQFTYDYARFRNAGQSIQLVPDAEFELGLTSRTQISVEMPLILQRFDNLPATTGGGHLEFGFRYLLIGSEPKSFAVSINPLVSPPTGNRQLAGDATEAGISLNVDKDFGERAFFHGNYGWSTTIGGTEERERWFFYRSAIVVPATRHWNPTLELLGQTDTATGITQLGIQPEVICHISTHWELKMGVPLGLTHSTANVGVRVQIVWVFGRTGTD